MLPKTGEIALVGGSSAGDRATNQRIAAFVRASYPAIRLIEITGLTLDEIGERVKSLPEGTFIYLGSFTSDVNGATVTGLEFTAMLHEHANTFRGRGSSSGEPGKQAYFNCPALTATDICSCADS